MLALLGMSLSALAQDTGSRLTEDADGDGFTVLEGDCNDAAPGMNPSRPEVCFDEIDNDCNSLADEFCDDSIRLGSLSGGGYITIGIDRRLLYAHRLAFLYMTGGLPKEDVDHINRVRSDNRWPNLRAATRSENLRNTTARSGSSGRLGVTWHKGAKKWAAQGRLDGRHIHLGLFADLEEAAEAARKWRKYTFGETAV